MWDGGGDRRVGTGLGELNMGGGGIGPISDTGIGGSGRSDNIKPGSDIGGGGMLCICFSWGGGVLPGGPGCPSLTDKKFM